MTEAPLQHFAAASAWANHGGIQTPPFRPHSARLWEPARWVDVIARHVNTEVTLMRKTLTALVTAATVAIAAVAAPSVAEAHFGGFRGGGFFFGGLAAGALLAGAFAPRYYDYGYPYGYYGYGPYYGGYYGCWRRHWNGWGWVRYRVC